MGAGSDGEGEASRRVKEGNRSRSFLVKGIGVGRRRQGKGATGPEKGKGSQLISQPVPGK